MQLLINAIQHTFIYNIYVFFFQNDNFKQITSLILSNIPSDFLYFLVFLIFSLGLLGAIINKHCILKMILSLELIYLSLNLFFIFIGLINYDLKGFIISLLLFSSAAAETVLILALLVALFGFNKNTLHQNLNNLT